MKKETLYQMLYMICDNTHAQCNTSCPVYALQTEKEREAGDGSCGGCFKNGEAMAKFVEKRLK